MNPGQDGTGELSTTALAKHLEKSPQELFQQLMEMGLIVRSGNAWDLTAAGRSKGGSYRNHEKFGRYIIWPESIARDCATKSDNTPPKQLTATAIGKHFGMQPNRVNSILSELGWIKRGLKGWLLTDLGRVFGGSQFKYETTGVPYVCWRDSITGDKLLVASIREARGETSAPVQQDAEESQSPGTAGLSFREKFEATHRATDGHLVRSRAELLIDNWLYMSEVAHAYERKLPVEEEQYCDFYIPKEKVYIEFWGMENDAKYLARKQKKLEIYRKYSFKLIELTDKDIENLDDVLPKKLLEFGVKTD